MGYIHIMLVGEHVGHVKTAFNDIKFQPIKRLYLLHSPNQTKANPGREKILFKNKAEELKKVFEASSDTEVILKELGKRGAFDKDETINQITKIVKEEMASEKIIVSQKQIAVNITGGTNMMAVGAILAAAAQSTEAYYVLDVNFPENMELDSKISVIGIPDLKAKELKKPLHDILFTILNNEYNWPFTVKERPYKVVSKKQKIKGVDSQTVHPYEEKQSAWKIDPSIIDTIWMKPQKIKGMITQHNLVTEMEKHGVHKNTTRNRIKMLEKKGMVRKINGIPQLTNVKKTSDFPTSYFRINSKEDLIEISSQGIADLQEYKP